MGNDTSKLEQENQILQQQINDLKKNAPKERENAYNKLINKRIMLENLLITKGNIMTNEQILRVNHIISQLPAPNYPQSTVNYPQQQPIYYQQQPQYSQQQPTYSQQQQSQQSIYIQQPQQPTYSQQQQNQIQLHHSMNSLSLNDFNNNEDVKQKEFEAELARELEHKRREFYESQKRRREEYQAKLRELDHSNIDALNLLGLSPGFTIEQLKTAYRKTAVKCHPDRGGDAAQFELVTKCYMSLLEKMRSSSQQLSSSTSSTSSTSNMSTFEMRNSTPRGVSGGILALENGANTFSGNKEPLLDAKKFDAKLFNKIYEQNKLWDPNDDGYDDWFKSGEDINNSSNTSSKSKKPPPELFGKKFNIDVFNSTFEESAIKNATTKSSAIVEYNEPTAIISGRTGFTDVANVNSINDFSKLSGDGSLNGIGYTDLKRAYGDGLTSLHPGQVSRKEYRSVEELKRERENISYKMSAEDERIEKMKKRMEEEVEIRRREHLQKRDQIVANHYNNTHQQIFGRQAQIE